MYKLIIFSYLSEEQNECTQAIQVPDSSTMSEQQEPCTFGGVAVGLTPHDHLYKSILALITEESLVGVYTAHAACLHKSNDITMLLRRSEDSFEN